MGRGSRKQKVGRANDWKMEEIRAVETARRKNGPSIGCCCGNGNIEEGNNFVDKVLLENSRGERGIRISRKRT